MTKFSVLKDDPSVVEVVQADAFTINNSGALIFYDFAVDPRMGTSTAKHTYAFAPGHWIEVWMS